MDKEAWNNCEPTEQQRRTYRALYKAAERMGANNYNSQVKAWLKTHKNTKNFRFAVTPEHDTIVKAMPKVLSGELSCEQAMALLWDYDVRVQRGLEGY